MRNIVKEVKSEQINAREGKVSQKVKSFFGNVKDGLKPKDIAKFAAKEALAVTPIVGKIIKDAFDEFAPNEKEDLIKELKELSESQLKEISKKVECSVKVLENVQKYMVYTFEELRADHKKIEESLLRLIEIIKREEIKGPERIDFEEGLNDYLDDLKEIYRRDDFLNLAPSKISAEDLFVPLLLFEDRTIASQYESGSEAVNQGRRETHPRSVDADDVVRYLISQRESAVILGIPGSGKTKVLRHWCYILAERALLGPSQTLPILVSAIQLTRAINKRRDKGLTQVLAYALGVSNGVAKKIFSRLKIGKAVFLVDGLDEVPTGDIEASGRRDLETWLEALSAKVQIIVVTCRKANYLTPLRFKKHFLISGLSEEKIEQFTQLWLGKDMARKFMDQYQENLTLQRLVENPLLLKIACLLYSIDPQEMLPLKRVELCKKAVKMLLKEWEDTKRSLRRVEPGELEQVKFPVLEAIALQMIEEPQRELLADRLYDIVGDTKPSWHNIEPPVIIKEIVHCGLLSPPHEGRYRFALPSFLEFFAASALHRRENWIEQVRSLAEEKTWHGALTFLAQDENDAEQLSNVLLKTDPLLAYDSTKEWKLNEHTKQRLMRALIQDFHSLEQHRKWLASDIIMKRLEVIPSPDEMAIIYLNLPDSAFFFLNWWADKLVEAGEEIAVEAFVQSLEVEGSFRKQISLRRLGKKGLGESVKEEIRRMINSAEPPEQWEAIHSLEELSDRESLPLLRIILEGKSQHRLVRSEAIRVLGNLGERRDLSAFQELSNYNEWVVSYFAKISIQEILSRYTLPNVVQKQSPKRNLSFKKELGEILNTTVSSRWGVSEVHYGSDNRWIFHVIETDFSDWNHMWNEVEFLHYAVTDLGIKYIYIEGGIEDDDLSYLRDFGNPSLRLRVALEYFKNGEIAPEEYLQIATNYKFYLWGIDDAETYNAAMRAIKEGLPARSLISSKERVDAISRNIIQSLSKHNTDRIVLITQSVGWDLTDKLKEQGFCYARIKPKDSKHPWRRPDIEEVIYYRKYLGRKEEK